MDNRIITLLLALGVSPAATYAADLPSQDGDDPQNLVISVNNLRLHFQTQIILQRLKEKGALSIIDDQGDARLVINGDRLDEKFFNFLSQLKNVKQSEENRDLVVSDNLAAAFSASGDLNDLIQSSKDEILLEELQKKMGTGLQKELIVACGASFS